MLLLSHLLLLLCIAAAGPDPATLAEQVRGL